MFVYILIDFKSSLDLRFSLFGCSLDYTTFLMSNNDNYWFVTAYKHFKSVHLDDTLSKDYRFSSVLIFCRLREQGLETVQLL